MIDQEVWVHMLKTRWMLQMCGEREILVSVVNINVKIF